MTSTLFTSGTVVAKEWLNDVNDLTYGNSNPARGAALLQYYPAGTGAVATTVQEKSRRYVDAFDFFTSAQIADVNSRTGSIDIRTPLNAALLAAYTSGQKAIRLPAGKYYCGTHGTADIMFDLATYGDNFTLICDGLVEFVCQTTASVIPKFFRLALNNNFRVIGTIKFTDTGYNSAISWKGAGGFALEAGGSTWGGVVMDDVRGNGLVYPLVIYGGTTSLRVRGVKIGYLEAYDCYYGLNCQNNGDAISIGLINSYLNYRPYYVYGCQDHDVRIHNRNNRGTSGAVNIARLTTGVHTKNIKVKYTARELSVATTHVLINHIDLTGGTIQNIELDLDIDGDSASPAGYNPLRFVNYDGAAAETSAASSNYVTDVRVKGVCSSGGNLITSVASYIEAGEISVYRSRWLDFDSTITDNFRFAAPASAGSVKTYTPSWVGSITNPAIGNGTLTGEYEVDDAGICHYSLYLVIGSTTTFGSGTWSFTAPFKARRTYYPQLHPAQIKDASAVFYGGTALLSVNSTTINVTADGAANTLSPTSPMTWATGDHLIVSGSYAL